jgi:hypothetical protein
MQQIIDINKFEELQELLVREIIEQIRLKLTQAGLKDEQLREATGEIAFSIASTIDDNANIEHNGVEVHPYLAFSDKEGFIIHCGENSCTHEFVASVMNQVFNN